MAHANRIIQIPDLRWCSNAHSDTNTDAYADSNSDTNANAYAYANTDSNSDACAVAKRADESSWKCGVLVSNQFVVDG